MLRLKASGLEAVEKAAVADISKADGTSINQFATTAIAEKIAAMKTAEFLPNAAPKPMLKRLAACFDATEANRRNPRIAGRNTTCHQPPAARATRRRP